MKDYYEGDDEIESISMDFFAPEDWAIFKTVCDEYTGSLPLKGRLVRRIKCALHRHPLKALTTGTGLPTAMQHCVCSHRRVFFELDHQNRA